MAILDEIKKQFPKAIKYKTIRKEIFQEVVYANLYRGIQG